MESKFFTITFFFDIEIALRDRFAATIIGSISGVRPTATEMAKKNASPPVALVDPVDQKHRWRHDRHEAQQQQSHVIDASVEARAAPLSRHFLGKRAKIGLGICFNHDSCGRSADYTGNYAAEIVEF